MVAAVDPLHRNSEESNLDHKLLSTIEFLSKQLSLSALVFHAYLPLLSSFIPEIEGTQEFLLGIKKRHEKILMDFLAGHTIEPTNIKISKGELVPGLTDYIEASATSILVIGALSRNILERAIIGDTAEQILEGCPCDVLVLKS
ncbi:MAG: universal stress protein [Proteobacteria bacterium]|nr:universal stress protein [Pseudomonadota bacterium]